MHKLILFLLILIHTSNLLANENLKVTPNSFLANDTPNIYKAIRNKEYKKLSILLKNGKDPCQQMKYQYKHVMNTATAFDYAIRTGNVEIVKEFLPFIKNLTKPTCLDYPSLFYAILIDDVPMIQFLIQNGANVNYISKYGTKNSAIEEALMHGEIKSARFLLKNGANMSAESQFKVLKHSVITLNIDVVKFLIKHKINLNYKNKQGNTILHIISMGRIDKNLKSLQKFSNSKYVQKIPGYRASIIETINELKSKWDNYPKIIQLLVRNGANYKLKNDNEKTPYILAKENNTKAILMFFSKNKK